MSFRPACTTWLVFGANDHSLSYDLPLRCEETIQDSIRGQKNSGYKARLLPLFSMQIIFFLLLQRSHDVAELLPLLFPAGAFGHQIGFKASRITKAVATASGMKS